MVKRIEHQHPKLCVKLYSLVFLFYCNKDVKIVFFVKKTLCSLLFLKLFFIQFKRKLASNKYRRKHPADGKVCRVNTYCCFSLSAFLIEGATKDDLG